MFVETNTDVLQVDSVLSSRVFPARNRNRFQIMIIFSQQHAD
jgi:hypothetical protein